MPGAIINQFCNYIPSQETDQILVLSTLLESIASSCIGNPDALRIYENTDVFWISFRNIFNYYFHSSTMQHELLTEKFLKSVRYLCRHGVFRDTENETNIDVNITFN